MSAHYDNVCSPRSRGSHDPIGHWSAFDQIRRRTHPSLLGHHPKSLQVTRRGVPRRPLDLVVRGRRDVHLGAHDRNQPPERGYARARAGRAAPWPTRWPCGTRDSKLARSQSDAGSSASRPCGCPPRREVARAPFAHHRLGSATARSGLITCNRDARHHREQVVSGLRGVARFPARSCQKSGEMRTSGRSDLESDPKRSEPFAGAYLPRSGTRRPTRKTRVSETPIWGPGSKVSGRQERPPSRPARQRRHRLSQHPRHCRLSAASCSTPKHQIEVAALANVGPIQRLYPTLSMLIVRSHAGRATTRCGTAPRIRTRCHLRDASGTEYRRLA